MTYGKKYKLYKDDFIRILTTNIVRMYFMKKKLLACLCLMVSFTSFASDSDDQNDIVTGYREADLKNIITSFKIKGVTPNELAKLKSLNLSHSQLTGSIPHAIGQLTELEELYLIINKLTGPIPQEIGRLTGLTFLDLRHNKLTGPIPQEIGQLTGLIFLDLSHNQLTGFIPESIGNLTGLKVLHLNSNNLTGPIPQEIGTLSNLNLITLFNNKFTSVPPSLLNHKNIQLDSDLTSSSSSDHESNHGSDSQERVPSISELSQVLDELESLIIR